MTRLLFLWTLTSQWVNRSLTSVRLNVGDEHCKKLHPPSVLGDDHLVGDVLKLPPQLDILQHHPQLSLRRVAFLAPSLQLALHGAQQPGHAAFVRARAACGCTTGVTSAVLGG